MKSPDIEFVYFDAGNTLLETSGINERLAVFTNETPEIIKRAWNKVSDVAQIGGYTRYEASDRLAGILGIDGPFDAEQHLFRPIRKPIVPMHQEMVLLAKAKVRVGIASNAWDEMVEISIKNGDIPNIDGMVVWSSANAKIAKPDAKAWQNMAALAQVPLQKIMLIDDDQRNIDSACGEFGEVFKVDPMDFTQSAVLLHARLIQLGLL